MAFTVRTNEDFDISMEFSFNTVLRAMSPTNVGSASNTKDESEPLSEGELAALEAASRIDSGKQSRKKKGGNKQKVKGVRGGQSSRDLDGSGMKQLQDILTEYEVTDEIIEDENCFCTGEYKKFYLYVCECIHPCMLLNVHIHVCSAITLKN